MPNFDFVYPLSPSFHINELICVPPAPPSSAPDYSRFAVFAFFPFAAFLTARGVAFGFP